MEKPFPLPNSVIQTVSGFQLEPQALTASSQKLPLLPASYLFPSHDCQASIAICQGSWEMEVMDPDASTALKH